MIVPILTMRVIAEERRQRTDQLLYSLPITTTQVVLGKYLALLVLYLIPLAVIAVYPLIFAQFGDVYLLTAYGSIFAFFLMGAALIALGVFISSLTENQGFAAGIGIAVILLTTTASACRVYLLHRPGHRHRSGGGHPAAGGRHPSPDGQRQSGLLGVLCPDCGDSGGLRAQQHGL